MVEAPARPVLSLGRGVWRVTGRQSSDEGSGELRGARMGAEPRGSGAAGMSTQGEDSACLSEECDEEAGGAGRRERRGQGCTGSSPGTEPAVLGSPGSPWGG